VKYLHQPRRWRGERRPQVFNTSTELIRARQQEIESKARQSVWRVELQTYRRKSGRMQVLRLRRR
jgi:hypothetical protein